MNDDEINKIAALVASKLKIDLPGIGDFVGADTELDCFTCSGRFKCRPSFMIQAPPPPPSAGGTNSSISKDKLVKS